MHLISKLKGRNPACLIPSHKKVERRLLSVLMGAMELVPSLRAKILSEAGYGSGKTASYQGFMEPAFTDLNIPSGRPDGLIFCERGKLSWSAFIEAKADGNLIKSDQIIEYAELAEFLDIDAIISISNEHALTSSDLPYSVNKKRLKKRQVVHLSWASIVVAIEMLLKGEQTLNETEVGVLKEVIGYMNTNGNGVQTFDQMPSSWNDFVTQANAPHGLNKNTSGVRETVLAWQQERRDLKLKLLRQYGADVDLWFDRKSRNDAQYRESKDIERLVSDYELRAYYYFSKAKVDFHVEANLKAHMTRVTAVVKPPEGKQAKGVVTWLLNSLSSCGHDELAILFDYPREKNDIFTTFGELKKMPEIGTQTLKTAPPEIRFSLASQSVRSFKSRKKFVEDVESLTFQLTAILEDAKII